MLINAAVKQGHHHILFHSSAMDLLEEIAHNTAMTKPQTYGLENKQYTRRKHSLVNAN